CAGVSSGWSNRFDVW
nr:immunoglobulin heavy chain junction region [Macaca mulatta]